MFPVSVENWHDPRREDRLLLPVRLEKQGYHLRVAGLTKRGRVRESAEIDHRAAAESIGLDRVDSNAILIARILEIKINQDMQVSVRPTAESAK